MDTIERCQKIIDVSHKVIFVYEHLLNSKNLRHGLFKTPDELKIFNRLEPIPGLVNKTFANIPNDKLENIIDQTRSVYEDFTSALKNKSIPLSGIEATAFRCDLAIDTIIAEIKKYSENYSNQDIADRI